MNTATRATLIMDGTRTMRPSNAPELRFLLHQAQERCPSTDDADMITMHVEALTQFSSRNENVRLVILNSQGEINRHGPPGKDRLGSSTDNRTD